MVLGLERLVTMFAEFLPLQLFVPRISRWCHSQALLCLSSSPCSAASPGSWESARGRVCTTEAINATKKGCFPPLPHQSRLLNIHRIALLGALPWRGRLWCGLGGSRAVGLAEWLCAGRAAGQPPASGRAARLGGPSVWFHAATLPPLPSERSQDSTAVALSDSSSTQEFFNEPPSVLEGARKPCAEKRPPVPSAQPGPAGKDLPGATEERGREPSLGDCSCWGVLFFLWLILSPGHLPTGSQRESGTEEESQRDTSM